MMKLIRLMRSMERENVPKNARALAAAMLATADEMGYVNRNYPELMSLSGIASTETYASACHQLVKRGIARVSKPGIYSIQNKYQLIPGFERD